MCRWLRLLAVVTWFSFFSQPGFAVEPGSQGKVYQDPATGLSVTKPDGWTVMDGEKLRASVSQVGAEPLVAFFKFDPTKVAEGAFIVNPFQNPQIVVTVVKAETELMEFAQQAIAQAAPSGAKPTQPPKIVQFNGREWVKWILLAPINVQSSSSPEGMLSAIYNESYAHQQGGRLIFVGLFCTGSMAPVYQPVVEQLMQSISLAGVKI